VDGTGRIQTVERSANPRYYGLIEEFGRLTGVPVLLNTSFNRKEPIVATPEDAIVCYLKSEMDVLVLGDFYTSDRGTEAAHTSTVRSQPALGEQPRETALTARVVPN
jgi:carbamoyltransferase